MPLVVGRHVNKVDRKGRVSVPKTFRDALQPPANGFAGIYAYPLLSESAIEACGEAYMARIAESVEDLDMFSDRQDLFAAAILESAHPLPFDPEGRVVLPDELIAHAGIDGEALFVGRGARFQIWAPAAYQQSRAQLFERMKGSGATLPLRRPREEQP